MLETTSRLQHFAHSVSAYKTALDPKGNRRPKEAPLEEVQSSAVPPPQYISMQSQVTAWRRCLRPSKEGSLLHVPEDAAVLAWREAQASCLGNLHLLYGYSSREEHVISSMNLCGRTRKPRQVVLARLTLTLYLYWISSQRS